MQTQRTRAIVAIGAALALGSPIARVVAEPAISTTAAQPYVLSPDDVLDISVAGHEELKSSVTVLSDGTINFPQVGTLHAGGKTIAALTKAIAKGLTDIVVQPDVTVVLRQSQVRKVSVLGAVRPPGQVVLNTNTRVLDVLAAAGGLTSEPDATEATLITDSGQKSTNLDVVGLMSGENSAQNTVLNSGDLILVRASTLQVQVMGEVSKPGVFTVPSEGISITSLLPLAGGALPDGALSEAQIMHGGKVEIVDLRTAGRDLGSSAGKTMLMPGDVLNIPAITRKVAVLGEVHTPGAFIIPDAGTLNLTTVLVMAGGTTGDADKKGASLLRTDTTGTAVATPIDVDALLRGRSTAKDVALQPGDIIYIPTKNAKTTNPAQILLSAIPLFSLFRR